MLLFLDGMINYTRHVGKLFDMCTFLGRFFLLLTPVGVYILLF
jgi:hypothetical protein